MNCLRWHEHWDRGFESHSSHGCLCVYSVFAFALCVGSSLATGLSLVQGVLPSVQKKMTKLMKSPGPNKGLSAINERMGYPYYMDDTHRGDAVSLVCHNCCYLGKLFFVQLSFHVFVDTLNNCSYFVVILLFFFSLPTAAVQKPGFVTPHKEHISYTPSSTG
jgi:hypothetical protein